uniref:G-protein coupled receptors family 1 profile domain-containing protein n=1 Tax=Rhinolophus ferrumequinum TaxID=59479 RepID=A0A671DW97_RHIFE
MISRNMCQGNQSTISEFLFLGLSDQAEQQKLLFVLFLGMYLATVVGNWFIILAISFDSYFHIPMYLFLANLSFDDISSISTPIPKMLINIQTNRVMAYDHFVAVCHPLNYTTIMQPKLCILLTVTPWVLSNIIALTHTLLLLQLCFCDNSTLLHFFCDLDPLLKLSCSDTMSNELVLFITTHVIYHNVGSVIITFPFALILFYVCIVRAVLRISSTEGKWKTFSTCASHLTVVLLFYGTIVGVYFFPLLIHPNNRYEIGVVLFTVITPMVNPFFYSLRNKDTQGALRKFIHGKSFLPLMPWASELHLFP